MRREAVSHRVARGSRPAMESVPNRPDPSDAEDGEEYPAGTEVEDDPPGVGDGDIAEDQPGLSEDPPQVD